MTEIESVVSQSLEQHTMTVLRNAVDVQLSILDLAFLRGRLSPGTHDWLFTHSVLCNDVIQLFLRV